MLGGRMRLFKDHPRSWRENRYVYPVISRRSRGLSIGINLNPDKACNFDCIYCCVDRSTMPRVREVDLEVVRAELDDLLARVTSRGFFGEPPFDQTPPPLRRLNDVAFSGDGEPTAYPRLGEACRIVHELLSQHGLAESTKIILITNATLFDRPHVREALDFLQAHHGQVWAKLDAGTEAYYRLVDRSRVPLSRVLENITQLAQRQPVVIQSLFLRINGIGPGEAEVSAYVERLRSVRGAGGTIAQVQVYTVARGVADASVSPLDEEGLERIAARVREAGFVAETFPTPR
jgi:wyosine [tRNA(Phe)-imidazoG37] synthetase (radical SAM superfamily)